MDDFKFVLRKDERLLGRVLEQTLREKRLKEERKVVDLEGMGKEGVDGLIGIAEAGGVGEETKKKKRKKRRAEDDVVGGGGKRVAMS